MRGVSTRLTCDPADESTPIWSAEDRRIFFYSDKGGHLDLYNRPSSGTGAETLLLETGRLLPLDVSPDAQLIAYRIIDPTKKNSDVWADASRHAESDSAAGDTVQGRSGVLSR